MIIVTDFAGVGVFNPHVIRHFHAIKKTMSIVQTGWEKKSLNLNKPFSLS